eukprot:scaffold132188_cov90-Phaeocystis_antarctica.AAC.1
MATADGEDLVRVRVRVRVRFRVRVRVRLRLRGRVRGRGRVRVRDGWRGPWRPRVRLLTIRTHAQPRLRVRAQ